MSVQADVGRNFRLIHGNNGMSDYLLISAHGLTSGNPFAVPAWTRLHFYAPGDRFLVMDMSRFNLSAVVEEQIEGGNYSPNYLLSKYQGRHGAAGETYATSGALVERVRTAIATGPAPAPVLPPKGQGAVRSAIRTQAEQENSARTVADTSSASASWAGRRACSTFWRVRCK